jgi:ADP-ribose pyrophosphatase
LAAEYPAHPRVAVGGVVFRDHPGPNAQVLLVRRNKPPALGEWAVPGGSVELGESLEQAVEREILEETGVAIRAGKVCHVFDDVRRDDSGRIRFHYVIVDLWGEYLSGEPLAATDVSAAAWKTAAELRGLNVNHNTRNLLGRLGFIV